MLAPRDEVRIFFSNETKSKRLNKTREHNKNTNRKKIYPQNTNKIRTRERREREKKQPNWERKTKANTMKQREV